MVLDLRMKFNPRLSVLLTTYNGEKYISECINSVLIQTFSEFQFIIVDDGSSDQTESEISSYNDSRIKYFKISRSGHANALNFGLSKCNTEFTTIIDHDDIAIKDKFDKQMKLFENDNYLGVVGTSYYRINEYGKVICRIKVPCEDETIKEMLLFRDVICHSGVMYKTDIVKDIGGYHQKYGTAADYALWLMLLAKTKFENISEPLMKIRVHRSSQTTPLDKYLNNNKESLHVLNDLLRNPPPNKNYIKGIWEIIYGDIKKGRKILGNDVLRLFPSNVLKIKIKYLILSLFSRRLINYYYYLNPIRLIKYKLKK